mgnify:CR=1 FL=1
MGIKDFFASAKHLLETINRPDWKTYSMSLKVVLIGLTVIGLVGYIVRLVAVVLQPI